MIQTCGDEAPVTAMAGDLVIVLNLQLMTEHEKCLTNGTYERARESGTEQNYDIVDGCVNNVPKKPRRIGGRWSVLDRLHIKQAERKQKEQTQQQQQERSRKN